MAKTQADDRFKTAITSEQIKENLKVLATFRTDVEGSSNLTIREGLFKKTTGKFNLFKGIVRDERDSLSNQEVLDAVCTNLEKFRDDSTFEDKNDDFDIICNAMHGFLLLGSKYRGRNKVENILITMSKVCKMARDFFEARLLTRYVPEKTAAYSQGIYSRTNKVHLKGTCWAMVMDWARRFVLKGKMGYAHIEEKEKLENTPPPKFDQNKLLHRGKYIARVMDLNQNQNYPSVGAALNGLPQLPNDDTSARTKKLLQRYYNEQSNTNGKNNRTVEQKFNDLSYTTEPQGNGVNKLSTGQLQLYGIHIGNLDYHGVINTRLLSITTLTNKINEWIAEANKNKSSRLAYGIGFKFVEKIGYQDWSVNAVRQAGLPGNDNLDNVNSTTLMFTPRVTKTVVQKGGHELGFAYDQDSNKCCLMDPNFGEWVSGDPNKIANLIYDVFKLYTVHKEEKLNPHYYYCASINETIVSIFAKKN